MQALLVPFLLVLARVGGLVMAAPVFGHVLLPRRVRAGLAALLAVAVTPVVHAGQVPEATSALVGALVLEAALGVLLGFAAQLLFAGVQLGGQLAGIQMGFGFANIVDPVSQNQVTAIAEWLQLIALLVFLAIDGHHVLLRALLASFTVVPPGQLVSLDGGVRGTIALAADLFVIGLRIAAPVLVVMLLVNGALGVLSRTIPQMNVFAVGISVNLGVGLVVLGAALPFGVRLFVQRIDQLEPLLGGLVRGLVHG